MLLDHLALAERHISEGRTSMERQHEVVRDFVRLGDQKGAETARKLLAEFGASQVMHIDGRDRIRAELNQFPD